jgi:hypothetical protein
MMGRMGPQAPETPRKKEMWAAPVIFGGVAAASKMDVEETAGPGAAATNDRADRR